MIFIDMFILSKLAHISVKVGSAHLQVKAQIVSVLPNKSLPVRDQLDCDTFQQLGSVI